MNAKIIGKGLVVSLLVFLVVFSAWVVWISFTPDEKPIGQIIEDADVENHQMVVGDATTATLIFTAETLLNKSGGYTSNDVMVKYVNYFDDMPNWEKGVLFQIRDLARATRDEFSRSQSTSIENNSLKLAEPKFAFDHDSWILPSTESKYEEGVNHLKKYLKGIANPQEDQVQFYARADNLVSYLLMVEKRLGGLSQNLSASVGNETKNIDLANDPNAVQSTDKQSSKTIKTPWLQVDDNYWQARGSVWALLHFFKAIKVDFDRVLNDKNAVVSVEQIIKELQAANESLSTPIVLNGTGRGLFANHSLTMSSYISRANAAVIDLRNLLEQG